MRRYLISFDDGSMDHIPEEELPVVGEAAREVVREAKAAGIWIFGGGLQLGMSGGRISIESLRVLDRSRD